MAKQKDKIINIKFEGIDDFGRPIFKDVDTIVRYGSVNTLPTNESKDDIVRYFKNNIHELVVFGVKFNCEPDGRMPSKYKLNIINEVSPQYVITGIDKSGKRFKPIHTDTPQHYNIWKGTIWKQKNGVRTKVKTIYN